MYSFASLLCKVLARLVQMNLLSDWDRGSYEKLVSCLLLHDDVAVKEAVDHLVEEGKTLAIPPIYLASERHPNFLVREYSRKALSRFSDEISAFVAGKDIDEAVDALVEQYGHFRHDYYSRG